MLGSILRSCALLLPEDHGSMIHGIIVKSGFELDIYVGTALIKFYSRGGDMDAAEQIFDRLPEKNSVTWTIIISGFAQSGKNFISLELFRNMIDSGTVPDCFVLSSVVNACSFSGFFLFGRQVHGFILRSGSDVDVSVLNVLIDLYCKFSRIDIARKMFDQMSERNLVSWTTMIAGYMQNQCDVESVSLFYEMNRAGLKPDAFALTSVLTSCGSLATIRQGEEAHCFALKSGLHDDEFVKNGLVDMYAKCGAIEEAKKSFETMVRKNVVSFNAMIECLASSGELREAAEIFKRMSREMISPTLLTFVGLLGASSDQLEVELSRQVHALTVKHGLSLDLFSGSALISVYSKCSCTDEARSVFNKMFEKDVVIWNAMITGYSQNGLEEEALRLFRKLKFSGAPSPGGFTFVSVLSGESSSPINCCQIHGQIVKVGFESDSHVVNSLMDSYAKSGAIQDARKLFDEIPCRDVVCWNSMITKYAQHGYAQDSLVMFKRMLTEGAVPNYVTFVGVLSACSHVGLVEDGLAYYKSMRVDFGIEPGTEHYACVVGLLGRAGRLVEAKEFIEGIQVEPPAVLWRALLGACQRFGDVDLGRYAARMSLSEDPGDSGSYVLLSNILASNDMWVDVEKVREGMDLGRVPKKPGCSQVF